MLFRPNEPIVTEEPTVVVDGGLPEGTHRFQLVVINDRGQQSPAAEIVVTITRLDTILPRFRPRSNI